MPLLLNQSFLRSPSPKSHKTPLPFSNCGGPTGSQGYPVREFIQRPSSYTFAICSMVAVHQPPNLSCCCWSLQTFLACRPLLKLNQGWSGQLRGATVSAPNRIAKRNYSSVTALLPWWDLRLCSNCVRLLSNWILIRVVVCGCHTLVPVHSEFSRHS